AALRTRRVDNHLAKLGRAREGRAEAAPLPRLRPLTRGTPQTGSFRFNPRGTRFRIYPQSRSVKGFETPIVVHVDSRPGTIGPGPADSTMYVVDAAGIPPNRWKVPYADDATGEPRWRPPYPRREPR